MANGRWKRDTDTSSRTREQCDRIVAWIKCAVSVRALKMNSALLLFALERVFCCCCCCCCVSAAILFRSANKRKPCAPRLTLRLENRMARAFSASFLRATHTTGRYYVYIRWGEETNAGDRERERETKRIEKIQWNGKIKEEIRQKI